MKFIQQPDTANVHLITKSEIILPKDIAAFQFDFLHTKGVAFDNAFTEQNDLLGNVYEVLLIADCSQFTGPEISRDITIGTIPECRKPA